MGRCVPTFLKKNTLRYNRKAISPLASEKGTEKGSRRALVSAARNESGEIISARKRWTHTTGRAVDFKSRNRGTVWFSALTRSRSAAKVEDINPQSKGQSPGRDGRKTGKERGVREKTDASGHGEENNWVLLHLEERGSRLADET